MKEDFHEPQAVELLRAAGGSVEGSLRVRILQPVVDQTVAAFPCALDKPEAEQT